MVKAWHKKIRLYDSLNFLKKYKIKICVEKVVGGQDLSLQQHFP